MSEERATATIQNDVIHFRPVARLKELARQLGVDIYLTFQAETHSANSIIGICAWELQRGHKVEVLVRGPGDLSLPLRAVVAFIEGGWGE